MVTEIRPLPCIKQEIGVIRAAINAQVSPYLEILINSPGYLTKTPDFG